MQKLLILAALAAVSTGQPASAQTVSANPSGAGAHRALGRGTEAGTRTLDRRIWRAVVAVCGTAPDYDIEGRNEVRQCRRDTRRVASAEADLAIAGASRDQKIQVSSIGK